MVISGRFMFNLRVGGVVSFSITLKSELWKELSPGTFHLNISDGANFHSSWNLTACNIARITATD